MSAFASLEPEPRETEEAHTIVDSMMVFHSDDAPPPTIMERKRTMRITKSKVKIQKGTLAPYSKSNGRKRLTISPAPEDKQLRKLDFGNEGDDSVGMDPRCKGAIFPANSIPRIEENLTAFSPDQAAVAPHPMHNLSVVSVPPASPKNLEPSSVSGLVNDEGRAADVRSLNLHRSNFEEKYKSKG